MMAEKRPIKEYAVGIYDGPHATPKEANDGPTFLGIKNVTPGGRLDLTEVRHISFDDFSKWTKRVQPQGNDIVFSYEATLHRYALIPEGFLGCLGRRMALVRPDPDKVNSKYLHYYFLSPEWRATIDSKIIVGATVDRIPIKTFPEFEVRIPTLEEQNNIASILSGYDDLIENNNRRIFLLEESARQLYREWFLRLRFPGHESARITDGVPEGWKKVKVGDAITFHYGKSLKQSIRTPGPYPVYGSSGIVGTHNKPLTKGPGIIIGRKGNVGSVFWSKDDFFPIDTVYFVDAENSSYYLYHNLKCQNFISSDVAVPGLNRKFAYSLPMLMPATEIARMFERRVKPNFDQIETLSIMNQKLKAARDLLLPKLMNGDIPL